ncbi:MAG TPA: hypothetical protein VG937_14170 [Polyangiaceae bacterium]|nr:hypothetical protein [Polyangiaceae bacterium]
MTDLSPEAASLVRAGRRALRPSAADRLRVSDALRARLGDAALPLEIVASTSFFSRASWAKISLATTALGLAGGALFLGLRQEPSPGPARAQAARPAETLVVASAAELAPPAAVTDVSPTTVETTSAEQNIPAKRATDRLAQEVAILSRATSELHAGRPANALKAIDEHARKFPNGLLVEERRAARTQALCALGRGDAAACGSSRARR